MKQQINIKKCPECKNQNTFFIGNKKGSFLLCGCCGLKQFRGATIRGEYIKQKLLENNFIK